VELSLGRRNIKELYQSVSGGGAADSDPIAAVVFFLAFPFLPMVANFVMEHIQDGLDSNKPG
jgi:hypothetical protein